jgi:hypothetical protein
MDTPIINLESYSVVELLLFSVGCYMWVIVYFIYIRNIIKYKFIEMPVFAAASNFAWEFVWGFIPPPTDMGLLIVWAYRIWFFIDIFIFYGVLKYGYKQISTSALIPYLVPLKIITAVAWGFIYYFFKVQGFDTVIGANSAYIAQILISILYVQLILKQKDISMFSYSVAWLKMIGSGLIAIFMFVHYADNHLLHTLCVLSVTLDIAYIIIFIRKRGTAHVDGA